MNQLSVFLLLLMLCFACGEYVFAHSASTLQLNTRIDSQEDTLSFRLNEANNLILEAVFNQEDTLELMFHTAANGVTLTKEALKHTKSIMFDTADSVSSWGGKSSAKRSEKNQLAMAHLVWNEITLWETEHSGPETDGKFGINLFADKFIEINYDLHIIVLHSAKPPISQAFTKRPLITENGFLFFELTSIIEEASFPNRFLIHSGYGGSILYDDAFAGKHQLGEKLEIISESELKDSYGNVLTTKKAILPKATIGKMTFEDINVGFFEGSIGRQKMSVMGAEMLRKFNWVIDIDGKNIYVNQREAK